MLKINEYKGSMKRPNTIVPCNFVQYYATKTLSMTI